MESVNGLHLSAHYLRTGNDRLAGAVTTGAWWGESKPNLPSWTRFQFHDTGFDSRIKKTNQIDDNRSLRPDGANLAAFLHLLKVRYADSYE
jgi:predicted ATPase